ncbi:MULTISPECIES: hypothetical protein [Acinetobacter]|uniref:hypothetical protein n=1 Tax=Acinetobacter TaxID=469 RepID=UPI000DD0634E|nr:MULTISPECIES: hypothetical protein [Acinetobacter]UIJ76204.1 hypothetical protein LXF01_02600 [Acinetobacter sp. SH20PTE14]
MKIKKRIFTYKPQPILHPCKALAVIFMFVVLLFSIALLLAWQGILFTSWQSNWQFLFLMSALFVISIFRDKSQRIKFPFWIQQHLIDPKLALDLKEHALRSSDAVIVDYREVREHWWQGKQQQLLLKLNELEEAKWFSVDLHQVFASTLFLNIHVQLNSALIGQQIWVHYLARTRTIVQLYAHDQLDDFHQMKNYFAMPYTGNIYFEQIPTRLTLDLPYLSEIHAVREEDQPGYLLKLKTSYGQSYRISSQARHFDKLELALSSAIDFIPYRNFKHQPTMQSALLTKRHPQRVTSLLLCIIAISVFIIAFLFKAWFWACVAVGCLYLLYRNIQHYRTSPFIEDPDVNVT